MFRIGYNTNGLSSHRLSEALDLISDLGYEAVAITPDVGALDPFRLRPDEVSSTRAQLEDLGLAVAIETGARFLLDPRRKHRPSLLEEDPDGRRTRVDFYRRCVDLAAELGAGVVSLWAGSAPPNQGGTLDVDAAHPLGDRLIEGLLQVLEHARGAGVRVGFEPEPGMFVERPVGFAALLERGGGALDELGLTLDVGHCVVTGDEPVSETIQRWAPRLVHVHLADCPRGLHQHVALGAGDLDLADTLDGLLRSGFGGIGAVELSRDGHRGPDAAREALDSIQRTLAGPEAP